MIRRYAQYMGLAIVLIGLGGLVLGNDPLIGLLNIDVVEDVIHLVTGGVMAYVGFRGSRSAVRAVVGGLGVLYLLVFALGLVVPDVFGLIPHGYSFLDAAIHLTLGIAGIALAWLAGDSAKRPTAPAAVTA